jgi:hypothetical protein
MHKHAHRHAGPASLIKETKETFTFSVKDNEGERE